MKNLVAVVAILFMASGMYAQKITLKEGDPKKLKSIKKWNVIFDYEGMQFDKKGSEEEWLKSTQAEKNEKEAGSGDAFVDDWNDNKEETFPMAFATGYSKVLSKKYGVSAKAGNSGATITVKTTWAFAGWRMPAGGIKPAKITSTITFKDADGNVLCVFEVDKAQMAPAGASTYNSIGYKVSERMTASYNFTGQVIAKYLKKAAYK